MTIYFIRHGETDWNRQGRLQGLEDIELNENGIRQAEICGQAFQSVPIDKIITSPLVRAKRTAEIIASHTGNPEVIVDSDFIERDFGRLSGLTPEEMKRVNVSRKNSEMENWDHLTGRAVNALYRYGSGNFGKNLIIVSHGALINAVLAVLSNHEIGTGKTILKNTCVNILHINGKTIQIMSHNLTPQEFIEAIGRQPRN